MKFGERLKQARINKKLTQEQVAEDFFITRQAISNWENEKTYPDMTMLIKLSDYYHLSLDTLLKEYTGMREYLEKKEVTKELKPIKLKLLIIVILWVIFIYSPKSWHTSAKTSFIFTLIEFFSIWLTVRTLIELDQFSDSNSLGLKYKWQQILFSKKGLKWLLLLPTILAIAAIWFYAIKNFIWIGLAMTSIMLYAIIFSYLWKK